MRNFLLSLTIFATSVFAGSTIQYKNIGLGRGWNTLENRPTSNGCLADAANYTSAGQSTFVKMTNVIDHAMLYKSLDISASVSAKSGAYSGSGSMALAESTRLTDDKDYFIANVIVQNGDEYLVPSGDIKSELPKPGIAVPLGTGNPIKLSEHYANLAKADPNKFRVECGDSFVNVVHTGASLLARFELEEHKSDARKSLALELQGNYATSNFKLTVNSKLNDYQTHHKLQIFYVLVGTSGQPIATTKEGLLTTIENLSQQAEKTRATYAVTIEPYSILSADIKSPTQLANDKLYEQYWKLVTLFGQAQYVNLHPSEYIFSRDFSSRLTTQQVESQCFPGNKVEQQRYQRIESNTERVRCLRDLEPELKLGRRRKSEEEAILAFHRVEKIIKARMDSLKRTIDSCSTSSCTGSSTDMVPDYEFRWQFPVRRQSFDDELRLEELRARWVSNAIGYLTIVSGNPQRDAGNRMINDGREIDTLERDYPKKILGAIGDEWVRLPAFARCTSDRDSPGCLDAAEQDKYIEKIQIR